MSRRWRHQLPLNAQVAQAGVRSAVVAGIDTPSPLDLTMSNQRHPSSDLLPCAAPWSILQPPTSARHEGASARQRVGMSRVAHCDGTAPVAAMVVASSTAASRLPHSHNVVDDWIMEQAFNDRWDDSIDRVSSSFVALAPSLALTRRANSGGQTAAAPASASAPSCPGNRGSDEPALALW